MLIQAVQQLQRQLEHWRLWQPAEQRGPLGAHLLAEAPQNRYLLTWRKKLAVALAGYNGCMVLQGESPRNSLWVVGREDSVQWVRKIYFRLTLLVDELSKYYKPDPQEFPPELCWPNWVRSQHLRWRGKMVHALSTAMELGVQAEQQELGLEADDSLVKELKLAKRWAKQHLVRTPTRKVKKKSK